MPVLGLEPKEKSWPDILKELGLCRSPVMEFFDLTEALAKKWEEQQIVTLLEEIVNKKHIF